MKIQMRIYARFLEKLGAIVYIFICYIVMARTIMVSDEVYEMLKKMKLPGESFSDVIKRLLKRRGSLLDIAGSGTVTEEGWRMLLEYKKEMAKADAERFKEILETMQ